MLCYANAMESFLQYETINSNTGITVIGCLSWHHW